MGAGKTTAARSAAEALGAAARRRRRRDRGAARQADRARVRRGRRGGVPRGRGAGHARAARLAATRQVLALGGGAIGSRAVRDALCRAPRVWIDVELETAWARVPAAAAGRWRATAASSSGSTPSASRSTPRSPTWSSRPSARTQMAPVLAALDGRAADGTKLLWAASAVRADYPVYIGRGTARRARLLAARRSPGGGSWSPTGTSAGCTATGSSRSAGGWRSCPASSRRRSPTPRSSGPSWRGPG